MSNNREKGVHNRSDSWSGDLQLKHQDSTDHTINILRVNKEQFGNLNNQEIEEVLHPNPDEEINPDKVENEELIKKNYQLREEIIRLKCGFEAEKFSLQYYASKIKKELQQILLENHYLRQKMNEMNYLVGSLAKIIKKSCKMYLSEREYPPSRNEFFDSDSEYDYNDPKFAPIDELQDQVQQLLLDYKESISMFSEKRFRSASFKNTHTTYDGFQSRCNSEKRKTTKDLKLGCKRSSLKKMSIYSGSFGQNKVSNILSREENKSVDDNQIQQQDSGQIEMREQEICITENDKIRWMPNDAYEECPICKNDFSLLYRKHHWRNWGTLVWDDWSPYREYVSGYRDERVRVCKPCYNSFVPMQYDTRSYGA